MSESERRRKYRYNRVLIDTERILDPQFSDAVVFLSGAQIEMLRNVTQYLNRLETYVTEYNPGYYLAPTSADYDDILEIVADLEETLMGNPNTIFGYMEGQHWGNSSTVSGTGEKTLYTNQTPSGEVWRVETLWARNEDTACTKIQLWNGSASGTSYISEVLNPAIGEMITWSGLNTLGDEGTVGATFYGCADGDHIAFGGRGYKMAIPE